MRKIILLIIVLVVIVGGWFLYFNNGEPASTINTYEVKYMNLENTLEFSGIVAPKEMYSVMSATGGIIETVHVTEGSSVKKGDALFDLDKTELESLLKEAQINYDMLDESQTQTVMAQSDAGALEKAKIALALSQATGFDYESLNSAFSQQLSDNAAQMAASLGGMTLEDTLAEGMDTAMVEEKIELAELTVQRLEGQIDGMSYESLIDGTVVSVNIHEGEVLSPGLPAMVIANTNETVINAYVYEKDLNLLKTGMKVEISSDDGVFTGEITRLGKTATSDFGTESNYGTMAKVEIAPAKGFNKIPGAEVDLKIVQNQKKNVLAIPLECITDESCVFIVNTDGVLEKREIVAGFQDMYYVEVIDGLSEGEKVVLSPQGLIEGQKVLYD